MSGEKRLTALLGSPVAHSISPAMHNMAFEELGIDCHYEAIDVDISGLEAKVRELVDKNVLGFNLTMPNKQAMVPLCDELSDAARISGSVNTVLNDKGYLKGYTTDGRGFMKACEDADFHPLDGKMVLLGAGGAAASILVQAALDGVPEISLFNRRGASWDKISLIAEKLRAETKCRINMFTYEDPKDLEREISDAVLLTNASSVGMAPDTEASLIKDERILSCGIDVYDIIYNPLETKLMKQAKAMGCRAVNGKLMLLYQGAAAFGIWTGKEMPVEKIKKALFYR